MLRDAAPNDELEFELGQVRVTGRQTVGLQKSCPPVQTAFFDRQRQAPLPWKGQWCLANFTLIMQGTKMTSPSRSGAPQIRVVPCIFSSGT